jgi:tetratricopeptide (TPR) repeat protein
VIEAFSAPPAFSEQGLGGEVLAMDLMNRLDAINRLAVANSLSAASDPRAEIHDDIKVEVPETGVSIGELMKLLRGWLGSERRVSGSLRQAPAGGIVLTAWLKGHEAVTVSGAPAELDDLERRLAERIYAQAEPANTVIYLKTAGRLDEARAAAAERASAAQGRLARADAYALWSTVMDPPRALALDRISLRINPGFMAARYQGMVFERDMGRPEAALALARELLAQKEADQPPQHRGRGVAYMRNYANYQIADLQGDYERAVIDRTGEGPGARGPLAFINAPLFEAIRAAKLHDVRAARVALAEVAADAPASARATIDLSGSPWAPGVSPTAAATRARYEVEAAAGDWRAAEAEARSLVAQAEAVIAASSQETQPGQRQVEQASIAPLLAEAQARRGDLDGAAATIGATPLDCYDCLRARGRIAALRRDWAGADRWFAEAGRQGPSLPFAEADAARMLLAKGDPAGAIAKLGLARQRAPRLADIAALWAEALITRGDYDGAARKFAEADRNAPRWGRNHLRWGEALMLAGRYREARAQFETANGMDLSAPDRAALKVLLARTASGPLHG